MNQLMSDKGVCRTAPATPGLLNINNHCKDSPDLAAPLALHQGLDGAHHRVTGHVHSRQIYLTYRLGPNSEALQKQGFKMYLVCYICDPIEKLNLWLTCG